MKVRILASAALALLSLASCGTQANLSDYNWKTDLIDGHRTGVKGPSKGDYPETVGSMDGAVYVSPNGRTFGGSTAEVAEIVLDAQPVMDELVREVIGTCQDGLRTRYPQGELSNLAVDVVTDAARKHWGEVDLGVLNFGGIRVSLPQGPILKDDIVSMFPFHNKLALVTVKGDQLRKTLVRNFEFNVQPMNGVKVVMKDGKVESLLVGGKEIDDGRIYKMVTVDFLLENGDNMHLADGAENVEISDLDPQVIMIDYISDLYSRGESVKGYLDDRVTIKW